MSFAVFIALSCLFVGILYFAMFRNKTKEREEPVEEEREEPQILNRF
jgi:preprotein translocase subunit YajC